MSYSYSFAVAPPTGFTINSSTGLITIANTAPPFSGAISVQVSDGVTSIAKSISIALTSPGKTALTMQVSENMAIGGGLVAPIRFLDDSGGFAIGGGIANDAFNVATSSATVAIMGPLVASNVGSDGGGGTPGAAGSDNFSDATIIPATCSPATQSLVNNGSNVGYTKEASEPPTSSTYQKTVWFKFTAPSTVSYTFSTVGSNFDTLLTVFSGTTFANLVQLATNDDGGGSGTSLLSVNLTSGQQYYIQVAGYNGASGNYVLRTNYTCA